MQKRITKKRLETLMRKLSKAADALLESGDEHYSLKLTLAERVALHQIIDYKILNLRELNHRILNRVR